MTVLSQILVLLGELALALVALWLLYRLVRFVTRVRAERRRSRVPRSEDDRRVRDRPVLRDQRQGARREEDLVEEALASREADRGDGD